MKKMKMLKLVKEVFLTAKIFYNIVRDMKTRPEIFNICWCCSWWWWCGYSRWWCCCCCCCCCCCKDLRSSQSSYKHYRKKQFCFSRFALKLVKHVLKGVNFINIFCACFSYKHLFGSFSLVTFGLAPKFRTKNARV